MKLINVFGLLFIASLSSVASASICPSEQIRAVQVKQSGEIVILNKSGKARLIAKQVTPISELMMKQLVLAVDKDLEVQIAYPDTYDCKTSKADTPADWVQIQNIEK